MFARDTLRDPTDDRHGEGVAERAVPRAIRCRLAPVFHGGPAIGKALKAFALDGRQAANGGSYCHAIVASAAVIRVERGVGIGFAGAGLASLKGVSLLMCARIGSASTSDIHQSNLIALVLRERDSLRLADLQTMRQFFHRTDPIIGATLPVEGDQRRSPLRSILARIEAIGAKGVRDERLGFAIAAGWMGVERMGDQQPVAAFVVAMRVAGDWRRDQIFIVFSPSSGISSSAAAVSAACKWSGNSFPRFSARRRMPAQARRLK